MTKNQIELRPTYWASFSGGKDSFYMLYYILNNLDRYPLDGVVHFELEIDYPFIKDIVDYVENELKKYNIPVLRIKPRKTWRELYDRKYAYGTKKGLPAGYPTRMSRWCNSQYKLDARKQLDEMMLNQGKKVICYIGFCYDEPKRFRYDINNKPENITEVYPLAEAGVLESDILKWARKQDIYNDFYKYNDRCGCMCCPMSGLKNLAYTKLYYPIEYAQFMTLAKISEDINSKAYGRPTSIWASNPKYNTEYRMKRVDEILKKGLTKNE